MSGALSPLRIAQVAPLIFAVPPSDHGGTERVVHDLTSALVARDHEVTLFAASGSRTTAQLIEQGAPVSSVPDAPPSLPSARECVMLARVAEMADQFDIIHCHTELYHAAVLAPFCDKLVMTIHWRADQMDRQVYFEHFKTLPVIAISASQAATLPPPNHLATVHHGMPAGRFRMGDGKGGYCAFLGRMTDQKRPDRAIAAARDAGLPVRLAGTVDVGNPGYFDTVVRPLLADDARYIGPLDDAGKQDFLGDASVFLFPIDWPEPFGLVMIEAMACGTPVVAWRNGSTAEIVDEGVTGFLIDHESEAAEAIAAARLLDRSLVRATFERRFTDVTMARGYENAYARLLGRACEGPA